MINRPLTIMLSLVVEYKYINTLNYHLHYIQNVATGVYTQTCHIC
jgi:hypothetical protein